MRRERFWAAVSEAFKVILWLALMLLVFGWLLNTQAHAETVPAPEFNQLASTIVGSTVEVKCYSPEDYPGDAAFVYEDWSPVIYIAGDFCGALRRHYDPTFLKRHHYKVGAAILALTHEAMHLKLQSADEGVVECTAWRNVWNSIKLLTSSPTARKLIYAGAREFHFGKALHGPYRTRC